MDARVKAAHERLMATLPVRTHKQPEKPEKMLRWRRKGQCIPGKALTVKAR